VVERLWLRGRDVAGWEWKAVAARHMKGGSRLAVLDVVEWKPMRRRRGCKAGSAIFGILRLHNRATKEHGNYGHGSYTAGMIIVLPFNYQ
jgi:hypothetical protein